MDVLSTRDSFLLHTERLRRSGRTTPAYCARMLMQDFLNNTFETTKFNSMDLEIWHHKLSVVSVIYIERAATYFYITKLTVPATKTISIIFYCILKTKN
jgi:hypothetical protein